MVDTFDLARISGALRTKNTPLHLEDERDRGLPLTPLDPKSYTFDRRQLWIVAYVQDQITGEVLQTIRERVVERVRQN
jgi:hypothetical protein